MCIYLRRIWPAVTPSAVARTASRVDERSRNTASLNPKLALVCDSPAAYLAGSDASGRCTHSQSSAAATDRWPQGVVCTPYCQSVSILGVPAAPESRVATSARRASGSAKPSRCSCATRSSVPAGEGLVSHNLRFKFLPRQRVCEPSWVVSDMPMQAASACLTISHRTVTRSVTQNLNGDGLHSRSWQSANMIKSITSAK